MTHFFLVFLIAILGAAPAGSAEAPGAPSSPVPGGACRESVSAGRLPIRHLYIAGNKVTKADVIKMFLKIDTGMVYDSIALKAAKERLEATNLFIKVALLPIKKTSGIDLYVVVKEPIYLGFPALDLTPLSSRYGQSGTWYCPFVGLEFTNLRGRMESLRVSLRLWEWRSLAVSWSKPLLPTPYFVGIGAFADRRPDNALHLDRLEYAASVTAGRKFFERSRAYGSIIPDYQEKRLWDSSGALADTTFRQVFGALGWYTDHRSSAFDPSRGWTVFFETRSNYIYYGKCDTPYVQFAVDAKFYHPCFFDNDKMAYRASLVSRTNDAGIQNRLALGGVNSVRGYGIGGIDLRSSASESFLFSWEYRFFLYQIPCLTRFIPSKINNMASAYWCDLNDLSPHIDGALIFDYGRVAKDFSSLASLSGPGYISGTDVGIGLRLSEPKLRESGCLDIVWPENPYTHAIKFVALPSWCAYLNLPF